MRDPETLLEVMDRDAEGGFLTPDVIDSHQVEATLILAEQVKRIADLLDQVVGNSTDKKSGKKLRSLTVTDLSRGTVEYG